MTISKSEDEVKNMVDSFGIAVHHFKEYLITNSEVLNIDYLNLALMDIDRGFDALHRAVHSPHRKGYQYVKKRTRKTRTERS